MLYLQLNKVAMKTKSQTIRVAIWVILGIGILLTSLALDYTPPIAQNATAASPTQADTATPTAEVQEDAGSTDGIMIVAVVIVLIVIIPILLRRQAWENGKRNRTAPPS